MKCVRGFDAKKELPDDSIAGAQVGVLIGSYIILVNFCRGFPP